MFSGILCSGMISLVRASSTSMVLGVALPIISGLSSSWFSGVLGLGTLTTSSKWEVEKFMSKSCSLGLISQGGVAGSSLSKLNPSSSFSVGEQWSVFGRESSCSSGMISISSECSLSCSWCSTGGVCKSDVTELLLSGFETGLVSRSCVDASLTSTCTSFSEYELLVWKVFSSNCSIVQFSKQTSWPG